MCFLNYILFIVCLLICLFFLIFDLTEFFIIFYFLSVFSLIYLQFFYGFVTGMSSDLVYIFYKEKYSKSQIIELFDDDKGNSTILKSRIKFLKNKNYIVEENNYYILTAKGKIFNWFYNIICNYLNVDEHGGMRDR